MVDYLDRAFRGRRRRVLEVSQAGLAVDGNVDVSGIVAGLGGGPVAQFFVSETIDFTQLTTGLIKVIPAVPGYGAIAIVTPIIMDTGTGTCTTGLTIQFGHNATEDDIGVSSAFSAATVNNAIAVGGPARLGSIAQPTAGTTARMITELSSPTTVKITVAAAGTGGFTLTGRIVTQVVLFPV